MFWLLFAIVSSHSIKEDLQFLRAHRAFQGVRSSLQNEELGVTPKVFLQQPAITTGAPITLTASPTSLSDGEDCVISFPTPIPDADANDAITASCGPTQGINDYLDRILTNAAQPPVTDVTVVAGPTSYTLCPSGYTKMPQDFNAGAGGDYVYVCYTSDPAFGTPLAALAAVSGSSSDTPCPSGYEKIPIDMNSNTNTHTEYIFLCKTRQGYIPGAQEILHLVSSDQSSCPSGYIAVSDQNLNEGSGGDTEYLCTSDVALATGSVRFENLIYMRCNYTFNYVGTRNGTLQILGSVQVVMKDGLGAPKQGHLGITSNLDEIVIVYVTGTNTRPSMKYGTSSSSLTNVVYGTTATYNNTMMCAPPATTISQQNFRDPGFIHTVKASGLAPSTVYFYQFGNDVDGWSAVHQFKSRPLPPQTITKFIAFADMGLSSYPAAYSTCGLVTQELNYGNGEFVLHFGDISYAEGTAWVWDGWFKIIESMSLQVPYLTSIGNHEYDHLVGGENDPSGQPHEGFHPIWGNFGEDSHGECGVPVYWRFKDTVPSTGFSMWWYSFNWGLVHVIQMSSEHDWTQGSEQYNWLENDLRNVNRSATPWVVLTSHRMMYTTQLCENQDTEVAAHMKTEFEDLLFKYQVNLMLVGHQHSYERICPVYQTVCRTDGRGTVHITIGSAGAGLEACGFSPIYGNYSVAHINDWGYLRLTADTNQLHAEYVRNQDISVWDEGP